MATITKFEDLDIWQFAKTQAEDFWQLDGSTPLAKDYSLRNQMNASSGSVMDCIAEGFDRSGNNEFKNFLVMAKGSNGEYRSQLYRCLYRKHISEEQFKAFYEKNIKIGNKLMSFITYLQNSAYKGQSRKQKDSSN
ncbi:MAG: four helix bundle protein [Flavisolibacter sp.]